MTKKKLPRFMVCSNPLVDEEDYLFVVNRKKGLSPVECIIRVSDMVCVSGRMDISTEMMASKWIRNYYLNVNK